MLTRAKIPQESRFVYKVGGEFFFGKSEKSGIYAYSMFLGLLKG